MRSEVRSKKWICRYLQNFMNAVENQYLKGAKETERNKTKVERF